MKKIIIIDGTYGVGKTTVANHICEISHEKYICIDADEYFNKAPDRYLLFGWPICNNAVILKDVRKEVEERIRENNIVIPLAITSSEWREKWIHSLQDLAELHYIVLLANREQILSRIINDDVYRDKSFAGERLDDNLKYYQGKIDGAVKIDTSYIDSKKVANRILDEV